MKISQGLGVAALMVSLLSCSSVSVRTDYDQLANFSNLQSYAWTTTSQKETRNIIDDPHVLLQINKAVDRQLVLKGYHLGNENPDFLLASHASVVQKSYSTSSGSGRSRPLRLLEGTLIIQIFNPNTRKLIWWGNGKIIIGKDDDEEARTKHIRELVQKLFERFPPK